VLARHGILGEFPDKVGEMVGEALRGDGLDLRVNIEAQRFDRLEDGSIRVALPDGETIETDVVLVSTGRRPNVDDVGLEVVAVDAASLSIAEDGRVSGPATTWLYAVGDAAGKLLLTHQGKYEARVTGDAIAARAAGHLQDHVQPWSPFAATADKVAVPQVVYTDPEVAMVGRSAEQAAEAGIRARVVERAIDVAGASLHADGYEGWAQMVVDEDRSVIVGLTFVGQDVSELLHAATIAIVGEVPLQRLWHAVPAYPAMSEIWLRLLEDYGL
jgi:dihydrolipoamide dehydrogenase